MRDWNGMTGKEVDDEVSSRVEEMARRYERGEPLRDKSEEYLNHHDPQDYVVSADIEVKVTGYSEIRNYRPRKRKKGGG